MHAAVLLVPASRQRGVEQPHRGRRLPRLGTVALQDQQQLGPLDEVPGQVTVGPEQILGVVAVVLPVVLPVGGVVLPDQPLCRRRQLDTDSLRQGERPVEIPVLAGGFERRKHRLAQVHVGVLAPVGSDILPVARRDLVRVETRAGIPESLFQQLEHLAGKGVRSGYAGPGSHGGGKQYERVAVAMPSAVLYPAWPEHPREAAVALPVRGLQERDAVRRRRPVLAAGEQLGGDRVVEYEAAGAHQVLGVAVVDGAIVGELVDVATALGVDARRVIEVDDPPDVPAQRLRVAVVHGDERAQPLGLMCTLIDCDDLSRAAPNASCTASREKRCVTSERAASAWSATISMAIW